MHRTRTLLLGAVILVAVALAATRWPTDPVAALSIGTGVAVAGIGAVLWSFRAGRHVPLADAMAATMNSGGVVFWKPGCIFCERLLAQLGRDPRIQWVNVWRDAEANAVVRSHNGGDELTPTAVVGDQVLRNPSASDLRAALDARG